MVSFSSKWLSAICHGLSVTKPASYRYITNSKPLEFSNYSIAMQIQPEFNAHAVMPVYK